MKPGRGLNGMALLCAAVCLSGCATPYQQMGFTGGVKATRITSDVALISARGNGFTDPDTIQTYALRRAAEETLNDGFDLFRIQTDEDRTTVGSQSFGSASRGRYSIIGSSYSMPIVKAGQSLMIRMSKGPRPDPMPDGLFDAHEIMAFMVGTPYGGRTGAPKPADPKAASK